MVHWCCCSCICFPLFLLFFLLQRWILFKTIVTTKLVLFSIIQTIFMFYSKVHQLNIIPVALRIWDITIRSSFCPQDYNNNCTFFPKTMDTSSKSIKCQRHQIEHLMHVIQQTTLNMTQVLKKRHILE